MKQGMDFWEKKRQKELEEFVGGWNWNCVYRSWKRRLDDFSVKIDPLFEVVRIYDPANPTGRNPELAWWEATLIRAQQIDSQRHFDEHPGTRGPTHPWTIQSPRGELGTLSYLWNYRDEPEMVAAILIAGSLFPRVESSRSHRSDKWPSYNCVKALSDMAYKKWMGEGSRSAWHYACTDVLPVQSDDYEYQIDSIRGLVRYIAEEHASLLHQYRPVVIEFAEERDPFIASVINKENKERQKKHEEWMRERRRLDEEEHERLAALKQKPPRYGEWEFLTRDELERLVWTKAVSQLATEYGVSDVAIGKRCKKQGISKPPAGFWNKVHAGKIPHPMGKPPTR